MDHPIDPAVDLKSIEDPAHLARAELSPPRDCLL
jgi:hypothetical protein